MTLEEFIVQYNIQCSPIVSLEIIKGVLFTLEILHSTGYTYNDLKLQNIMIPIAKPSNKIIPILIDYGFASKFTDKNG